MKQLKEKEFGKVLCKKGMMTGNVDSRLDPLSPQKKAIPIPQAIKEIRGMR